MTNYQRRKFLVILVSPTAGGKSTIAKALLREKDRFAYSISYTTRLPRGEEINGKDYHFVSWNSFKELIASDKLLEYAEVHEQWYGTSRKTVEKLLDEGLHVVLDLDYQGAYQIREKGIDNITIFLLPPSERIWKKRLLQRGTDSAEMIEIRLKTAEKEFRQIRNFDYLVINDSLDETIAVVRNIISAEEYKVSRYKNFIKDFREDK
ncbi:MAG: guanylate kinase [Candidatus Cloacimonetes bacterium]|nr:guanylate kinase [Candidatus Cloacimonadota bacterium]